MKAFSESIRITISLLLIAVIFLLWHYKTEPLATLSHKLNDIKYAFNKQKPHEDVVFVSIDEKSVSRFGRWPWDRERLAQKISVFDDAQVVVFDMVFSEPTQKQKDLALADAIFDLNDVICGFFLRHDSTKIQDEFLLDLLVDSALHRVFLETAPFLVYDHVEVNILDITQSCMLSGVFSTVSDSDSLFRRYPIAFVFDGELYPSLGIQTLRYILNKDITMEQKGQHYEIVLDQTEFSIDSEGFVMLNYYDIGSYNIIPFADLLDDNFDTSLIEDKIVVFGVSEAGVTDIRATPLGQIPGPLLHYSFIANYLDGILLQRFMQLELGLVLLFSLIPLFLSKVIRRLDLRIFIYSFIAIGYIVVNIYLYQKLHYWIDLFYPLFGLFVLLIFNSAFLFKMRDKESKFIKSAFGNYLSKAQIDTIMKNPSQLKLGGQTKDVSILFTDIRGFTTLSERVSPEELISILELYFTPMTQIVLNNGGTLDKYIGDAIMAFYNAPVVVKEHPKKAVKTALEMVAELENINKKLTSKNLPTIDFGAGINSGDAVVGNIGSLERFDYSVIGDSVNLASRVEGLCKTYGVHIVITQFTKQRLDDQFLTRELDDVVVKGKSSHVTVYEVMQDLQINRQIKALYEDALKLYRQKEYTQAAQKLHECYEKYSDKTSLLLLQRIESLQNSD